MTLREQLGRPMVGRRRQSAPPDGKLGKNGKKGRKLG